MAGKLQPFFVVRDRQIYKLVAAENEGLESNLGVIVKIEPLPMRIGAVFYFRL